MYETTLFLLYFSFMLTCYNNYYSSQKELGRDWSEINSQLVSLRATLGQNLRKINNTKSGQGTDELFEPSWIFFKSMQFLVPVMEALHNSF